MKFRISWSKTTGMKFDQNYPCYLAMWFVVCTRRQFRWLVMSTSCLIVALATLGMACSRFYPANSAAEETAAENCQDVKFQNIEQLIYRAETAENSQETAEAERLWREVIQLEPDAIWAHNRLGFILYQQNILQPDRLGEAVAVYRQAIQRNREAAESYYGLGKVLLAQQKLPEAIAAYRQAIDLNPNYAVNVDWFAPYLSLEQVVLALFRDRQEHPEHRATSYLLLGDAFRQARQTNQAMEFAQENFLELCQQYLQGCSQPYRFSSEQEISAFQQAIQLNPHSAAAYETLGISLYEMERYDEAIAAFRQAIQFNPQYVRVYYRLGDVLIAQDKLSEAVRVFYQAAQAEPRQAGMDLQFWVFLARQSQDKLIAALTQELQTNPSAVNYYVLGNVLAGRSLAHQPELRAQAIATFQQAIQLEPTFAKAYDRLGFLLSFQNRLKEAEQAFRQATQLDPTLISAHDNLRELLRMQQKFEDAARVFCDRPRLSNSPNVSKALLRLELATSITVQTNLWKSHS